MPIAYRYKLPSLELAHPVDDGGLQPSNSTYTAPGPECVSFAQVWRGKSVGTWLYAHLELVTAAEGEDGAWYYIEDHRQHDHQGGTQYWLSGDNWQTEGRYIHTLGPLPEGAVLKRPEKPAPTLEEARTAKLDEINAGYASVIAYIQAGYPPDEVLSWPVQAAQASELTVDGEAKALFVRSLAATKGLSVEEMRDRILVNAENWEPIAGMLTGQRQRMEEAALVAESVEAIAAIRVAYTA